MQKIFSFGKLQEEKKLNMDLCRKFSHLESFSILAEYSKKFD
jgi:hypothetical protein